MVISDPSRADLPIIYASEEFQHQTGYSAEEVLGRNCRFLQGPETDPRAAIAIREAIRERNEITVDILNYRKDGSKFWNRLHIRPLYDARDHVLYFAGVQSQIDARDVRFTEFPVRAESHAGRSAAVLPASPPMPRPAGGVVRHDRRAMAGPTRRLRVRRMSAGARCARTPMATRAVTIMAPAPSLWWADEGGRG